MGGLANGEGRRAPQNRRNIWENAARRVDGVKGNRAEKLGGKQLAPRVQPSFEQAFGEPERSNNLRAVNRTGSFGDPAWDQVKPRRGRLAPQERHHKKCNLQ